MRARRGTAAIEFALTAPVVLIIALGLVEWGWVFDRDVAVVQAVRDGALAGSCTRNSADPAGVAQARVLNALEASGFSSGEATVTATLTTVSTGQLITVHVRLPYHGIVRIIPTPSTLEWTATMQMVDAS